MESTAPGSPSPTTRRARLLAVPALAAAAALALHGPIAQWPGYHHFADTQAWAGIPNAANVLSNLGFAAVGLWGLRRLAGRPEAAAWRLLAWCLLATAAGSTLYHWSPADGALVADRLPIACACAVLSCAFLAERVDERWALGRVLAGAAGLGALSVAEWWSGQSQGLGDLRMYAFIQFLPMLLIPTGLALRLAPRSALALPDSAWWSALALYALAKATELADASVMQALGGLSGHTVKHLLAAAAAAWLLHAASPQTWTTAQNR